MNAYLSPPEIYETEKWPIFVSIAYQDVTDQLSTFVKLSNILAQSANPKYLQT